MTLNTETIRSTAGRVLRAVRENPAVVRAAIAAAAGLGLFRVTDAQLDSIDQLVYVALLLTTGLAIRSKTRSKSSLDRDAQQVRDAVSDLTVEEIAQVLQHVSDPATLIRAGRGE